MSESSRVDPEVPLMEFPEQDVVEVDGPHPVGSFLQSDVVLFQGLREEERNCSPYPVCRIGRSSARLAAGCWEVERRRAAEDRYPPARSWGSVTVPGLAIARRVASARYAAGSTPASFADSISV